jgi:prepilin-type N-terminal cleavage/methylation domain-containing protein
MVRLRKLIQRTSSDEGMTLIEVVVALMVFSVISLGVGYSAISIVRITEDTRARQVATNFATSELDLARGTADPFDIVNGTRTTIISGTTYTLVRSTSWVETSGADVGCGTGTGKLQAKRVNVTVTWSGMLNTTPPVRSDTLISPDDRINDPSLGTIRVSVLNVLGTGSSGVDVAIAATSGGAALASQPDDTDTDGCSYALKVMPGTYSVTISRSNSIDSAQVTSPVKSVTVTAGGSVAAQFQYDYAARFNLVYAGGASGVKLPTNPDTTYLSTYGTYVDSGTKSQINLHPIPSGYAGMAGKYVAPSTSVPAGCVSVDPAAWPAATVNGVALAAGVRTPAVAAAPQGQVTMNIPMGITSVKQTSAAYLFAISATASAAAGDPGCGVPMTYAYGNVLINGTINVALPYGSWTLYSSTTAAGTTKTAIPVSNLGLVGGLLGLLSGNVITLDPRVAG